MHLGEGVVGTVAQRRIGMLVNDCASQATVLYEERCGAAAILAEPLLERDHLLGVLLLSHHRGAFTVEHQAALVLVGAHASTRLASARLHATLHALTRLNQGVAASPPGSDALHAVAQAATAFMHTPVVTLWLAHDTARTLALRGCSAAGARLRFPVTTLPYTHGVVGWAATHRRPLHVPDVGASKRGDDWLWLRAHQLHSVCALPLLWGETLLAVLVAFDRQPFHLTPDDQPLLQAFLAQAAVVVRTACLGDAVKTQATRLAHNATHLTRARAAQQRTAALLSRLRQQHRLILDAVREGIYGLDTQGQITFVNTAAVRLLGWDATALRRRSLHDVLSHGPGDGTPCPAEACPILAALHDGTVHHLADQRWWRQDGTCLPVEWMSAPVRDHQEVVIGAVVVFSDLSELQPAERGQVGAMPSPFSQLGSIVRL